MRASVPRKNSQSFLIFYVIICSRRQKVNKFVCKHCDNFLQLKLKVYFGIVKDYFLYLLQNVVITLCVKL